jgi:hypothetical protein
MGHKWNSAKTGAASFKRALDFCFAGTMLGDHD